jgi:hypothetical protein
MPNSRSGKSTAFGSELRFGTLAASITDSSSKSVLGAQAALLDQEVMQNSAPVAYMI